MTTHTTLDLSSVHPSWLTCLNNALAKMDSGYLQQLATSTEWLPGATKIFNAFSIPFTQTQYVLLGESPYPRTESANGYAFWDASVNELWSSSGLSKKVNRATSLRNMIKMLLIAEGLLDPQDLSQAAIARINKASLIQSNQALFNHLLNHGFLLLNATLVLQSSAKTKDARAWYPFIAELLRCLLEARPQIKLILLGQIAYAIEPLIKNHPTSKLYAEHPYNLSFITNPAILAFFRPLHLLKPNSY